MLTKTINSNQQAVPSTASVFRGFLICVIGLFFVGWINLLQIEPSVAVLELMHQFQIQPKDFGELAAKFFVTYTITLFLAGLLVDIFGPRKTALFSIILAVIGNYILGHGVSGTALSISRGLTGISCAFVVISVLKIAVLSLPKRHFVVFVGFLSAAALLFPIFGESFLSAMISSFGWSYVISLMNVIGVILLVLVFMTFSSKNYTAETRKIISLDEILAVIKNPRIYLISLISMFGYLFVSNFVNLWGVSFLKQVFNFSATQAFNLITISVFGLVLGSISISILSNIFPRRRLFLVLGYLFAALLLLVMLYSHNFSYSQTSLILFIIGFFLGVNVICYAIAYDYITPANAGMAFGFISVAGVFGSSIIQSTVAKILRSVAFNNNIQSDLVSYSATIRQAGLLIIPVTLIIGALLALFLRKTKLPPASSVVGIWNELGLYWKGRGNLGRSYWLINVLGSSFVRLIIFSFLAVFSTFNMTSLSERPFIYNILILPYQLFASVCVWRCAKNTNWWIGWKYIARILILIEVGFSVMTIFF